MQQDLIKLLERFNRKERFYLVRDAIGKSEFRLSDDFRGRLQNSIGLNEQIPASAFIAMDYHLDWLAACLAKFASDGETKDYLNEEKGDTRLVEGNQEDVDFLVAFKGEGEIYYLIFLEAKAYSGWSSKQMRSKAERMKLIFEDDGKKYKGVKPYFCLVSPGYPAKLDRDCWPKWWKKPGYEELNCLKLGLPTDRLKVTRWDACHLPFKASRHGKHFRIVHA